MSLVLPTFLDDGEEKEGKVCEKKRKQEIKESNTNELH
jgi:hypothetical protein